MEPTVKTQQDPNKETKNTPLTGQKATTTGSTSYENTTQSVREKIENRGSEIIGDAKQTISEAYDKTSRNLGEKYEKAMEYGRENPGTMTLIAFGAGIGVGLLLASSLYTPRTRASRVVPPVMNALSTLVDDLFR